MILRWSELAGEDLEEIYKYIAKDNEDAAGAVLSDILTAADRLLQFPQLGREAHGGDNSQRHWVIAPYVIIYRIVGDVIQIVNVYHGSRKY